jgi:tetratricopeptide (TPR) repeat protein
MQSILLRRLGRFSEALASAEQAVRLNPRYAKGWSNRASILFQMGDYQQAILSADQAIAYERTTGGAYAAKAAALGQLGRSKEARACLEEGLRAIPGHPLLVRALGAL